MPAFLPSVIIKATSSYWKALLFTAQKVFDNFFFNIPIIKRETIGPVDENATRLLDVYKHTSKSQVQCVKFCKRLQSSELEK